MDTEQPTPDCTFCGSIDGQLTFAFVTEEPLDPEETYEPTEPCVLCEQHMEKLTKSNQYFVRTVAPVPSESGDFSRAADQRFDILYNRDVSESCWIRFNPDQDEVVPEDATNS